MKRFFSLVALLMVAVAITPIAEAKKFGGGKSFGKSYKTAPAPKQQTQKNDTIKQTYGTLYHMPKAEKVFHEKVRGVDGLVVELRVWKVKRSKD